MLERSAARAKPPGSSISDPASVTPDRAIRLARRREVFQARRQMAGFGKKGEWQNAIHLADLFLRKTDDQTIRFLRGEALLRAGNKNAGEAVAQSLPQDNTVTKGESALLRGDQTSFVREADSAINRAEGADTSPLDANNAAWLAALTPNMPVATVAKAVSLSERAVQMAEASEDPVIADELATYTNTLGGVYYRAGRDDVAISALLRSERLRPDPFNAAFLALAYHRTGSSNEAAKWRNDLTKYLTQTYATRDGQNLRHQLLLLWREVESQTQESPLRGANK